MKFRILAPCLLLALGSVALVTPTSAQIVINEMMSANRDTTADEDGDYEDWIELRNTGGTAVDLAGYGLSDNPASPFKWTFPSHVLPAGGYVTVWASGKDRAGVVPQTGLLREVFNNIVGGSVEAMESSGNYPAFPDSSSILTTNFNVPRDANDNYGQRVSGILTPLVSGDYDFGISADNGSRLYLGTSDDPATARVIAEVPADRWSNPDTYTTYATQNSAQINLEAGKRYFVMALMKEDTGGDHLTVRWRRDGNNSTQEVIPASRFIAKPSALHANFKISAEGEPIQLTRPDGGVEDVLPAAALKFGESYGRSASNPAAHVFFTTPTRGAANSAVSYTSAVTETPVFSVTGGFYNSAFPLTLSHSASGASIIYTVDGSIPDPGNTSGTTYTYKDVYNSARNGPFLTGSYTTLGYSNAIQITDRSGAPNGISQRTTTYGDGGYYKPQVPVFKGTVVRARLIRAGELPGPVVTHSYFVGSNAPTRYQLPVVSLSINEDDLFDYSRGFYVAGEDYEKWRTYATFDGDGGTPANYKRRSDLTERPVNFELFQPGQGRVLSQNLGVRMHGGWSRAWPQKSLRFYSDSAYDPAATLDYPLIPGLKGTGTGTPVESFSRFILRNAGNDHEGPRLRDAFIQELAKPLKLDMQGYQPAVHFINGEFWGLTDIRERIDRYFIESHHAVDPDKVAILSNNAEISEGTKQDRTDFLALRSYISSNDMSNATHYNYVKQRMDVENFIRYNVTEIYANNRDWPHNNIDMWRVTLPGGPVENGGTADGRWRWILFDLDFGFNFNGGPDTNTLAHAVRNAGTQDWSTVKLRRLLANTEFRNRFINTFADHMATSFRPSRVNALADEMRAVLSPYYGEHDARWRNLGNTSVTPLKDFGISRPGFMRTHLLSQFGLSGTSDITLHTPDATRGSVQINDIVINGQTPGLTNPAQPYPWTGMYFQGVPVKVTARPAAGYRFLGWQELPGVTNPELTVSPGSITQLTALFEVKPVPVMELLHYWNFNTPTTQLTPNVTTISGASLAIAPGPITVVESGTGQDFAAANARNGDTAGAHLRVNEPIGAVATIAVPTTYHDHITVIYETRRSGQGAGTQTVTYTTDGTNYLPFGTRNVTEVPTVQTLDFTEVAGVSNNPLFRIRVAFSQGGGGISGNNRFDNLTVEGAAIPGLNRPPVRLATTAKRVAIENGAAVTMDLAALFDDPDDDTLTYAATVENPAFGSATVNGTELSMSGTRRGELTVSVTASDGEEVSLPLQVTLLVYPQALVLADEDFAFSAWSPDEPEFTYPEHALFLQSDLSDPVLTAELDRAYAVRGDHPEADAPGFPYKNTGRTRINGLGANGISFINTGRSRDVGGLLLALDTRGVDAAELDFTAATQVVNLRKYALRLQDRIGHTGAFSDVLKDGAPVVYANSTTAGDQQLFTDVPLPAAALGQPYVQVLWRYHYLEGTGARPEMRLDDIVVAKPVAPLTGFALWQQEQFPDPEDLADPAVSGPLADPLGLGVGNLVRYALGISDADDLANRLPQVRREEDGTLGYRFPFDASLEDVTIHVEASAGLEEWDEVEYDPEAVVDGWITIPDLKSRPGAGSAEFFRVKVTLDL